MSKRKLEKFGLQAIQTVVNNSDVHQARESLAFAIGSRVEVVGRVMKVVTRNGQSKLFIQPFGESLTVFADCSNEVDTVGTLKRGAKVKIIGKLAAFGLHSANLSDCRLKS
jgi:hypothetical protein